MFDYMVTPWIIRILYWIMQISIIIFGFVIMFSGGNSELGLSGFGGGLLIIIVGTLIIRLFFEMLMVQFKISENTSQMKDLLKKDKSEQISN